MANKLIPKKSSTPAKIPLATDLEVGELAVNLSDRKIYSKNAAWQVVELGGLAAAPVTSVAGKTGAVTLAKGDVGLGSVDNTADSAKPVSTAQQTALNAKVDTTGNQNIGGIKTFLNDAKFEGQLAIKGDVLIVPDQLGTSAGNFGIGVGAPAAKFAVSTGDHRKQFVVNITTDPVVQIGLPDWYNLGHLAFITGSGGERMRITSAGNVGIGTSTPGEKLVVTGNTVLGSSRYEPNAIELNQLGTGDRSTYIDFHSSGAPGTLDYSARVIRDPGVNGELRVENRNAGAIALQTEGSGAVIIRTANAERMRIASDGNVGIGTSSPAVKLEVSVASGNNEFRQSVGGVTRGQLISSATDQHLVNLGTGSQQFWTSGSERMRIDSSGKVGIGTSSPAFKLDNAGVTRLGTGVAQSPPSATNILSSAHTILSGKGANYLTFGQYGVEQLYAQWIQSSFVNPTTATYNLVLQPLGGNVDIGTSITKERLTLNGRLFLSNQSAPPPPSGGGVIYVEDGALKYRGSSGTVTVIGAA